MAARYDWFVEEGMKRDDEGFYVRHEDYAQELADAQAEIARLRGALEVLETGAHFIFNNPPGETSQDVRDVIEWFAGSIRVALEQAK